MELCDPQKVVLNNQQVTHVSCRLYGVISPHLQLDLLNPYNNSQQHAP